MENNLLDDLDYLDKDAPKLVYVGFVKRFLAAILDILVVGVVMFVLSTLRHFIYSITGGSIDPEQLEVLIIPFMISYAALMESSKYQATLGKQALGIKVVGKDGERILPTRAAQRFVSKAISYIILLGGFLMIAITEKNQGLHDMITETFVVENNARYN